MKGFALCVLYNPPCVGRKAHSPSLSLTQTHKSCVSRAAPRTATSITPVTYACVRISSHPALVDGSTAPRTLYAARGTTCILVTANPPCTKWLSSGSAWPLRRSALGIALRMKYELRTTSRARIS